MVAGLRRNPSLYLFLTSLSLLPVFPKKQFVLEFLSQVTLLVDYKLRHKTSNVREFDLYLLTIAVVSKPLAKPHRFYFYKRIGNGSETKTYKVM